MKKIIVRGFKREQLSPDETKFTKESKLELKNSYILSSTRGIGEAHELSFEKTDVLEFVFEDNTTWMGSSDIIHDIFPKAAKQTRAVGEAFIIPMYLETDDTNRGLLGDIALKVLNVFTKKAVTAKVIEIAANLEKKLLENMSGLYSVNANFKLSKTKPITSKKPYLLFIHGTNSSTAGSFSEINNSELWKQMRLTYGENILGFQHETLTKSPIQNVIDLFNELPGACTLHIITHSRGGLVGDVLARFCNDNAGFTDTEITYLQNTNRTDDIAGIKKLQKITAAKKITIDRFIRVACPAYGTTILSKRLDHFLNISFNLIGLISGGVVSMVAAEFKNLIAAAVDTKNDPNDLPGLEAMNPDSAFLKVLNNPVNSINGSLTVISGNCGIKFNLKALLIIASKLFYLRDNDLVVDTKSMYCGTKRNRPIQYFFDEGPEVDHVHYFKNQKTQNALLKALNAGTDSISGFITYEPALDRNALLGLDGGEVYKDKVSGNRPIAILLPGIMGSNLEQDKKKIWINYARFLVGELGRLDISKKDIEATSLIKTSYKKLVDHLSDEYDVVTHPFDWRLPLTDAATLLKDRIEKYLALKTKPAIKIVGHSMGGVVVRDFIINHPATWKKLNASKDFKLLLLGAPLGGSYRIPYVLAGKDPIIIQLSKIDLRHTKKELLDMFRKYPGLLGLLPIAKDRVDFADENTWKQMKNASLFDWNIPDKKDLQFWGAYRDNVLQKMDLIELENVIYIAGKDDATVCGFEINNNLPDEKLVFKSTIEGDQSVTWDTGIPLKLNNTDRVYFVNVSHGGLANNVDMFTGISEILKNGKTELLSRNKPVLRGVQTEFDTPEAEIYNIDERSLENTILGIKEKTVTKKAGSIQVESTPLKVSVSNGDLLYSRYPVLVGHFLTDGITGAEYIIDSYTGNLLRERHRLNLYPGAIGTSQVILNSGNEFKGTVVIGLGQPARLSALQLTRSVENGAIEYMMELKKMKKDNVLNDVQSDVGLSVLLIGSSYGGLSIESSIRAILLGIQNANIAIATLEGVFDLINSVEFVEIYEDRCLQCLYVLSMIETTKDISFSIRLFKKQIKKLLGSRTRMPMDKDKESWSRISITEHIEKNDSGELNDRALRFSINTGKAREEQKDLYVSANILNELIEDMSTNNNWDKDVARTVFELLIPNDFKDEIKKQFKTMWVLDNTAAVYPWELLHDSSNSTFPICYNTGMIRQLQTDKYRSQVEPSSGNKVLIIGDPDLNGYRGAPQLPGALEEAKMVADLLNEYGCKTKNSCFQKSSVQIIKALFKDEYRIIHLAGHGVFNKKSPNSSGMLIGNNVFLSAKEISQMSKVPDLVFVNCCFLGKVDAQSEELFSNRYRLAANIGTQLIMNGVKVVIAAGWAVEDKAAKNFTEVFYRNFLNGINFGDAITAARKNTFERFPGHNTWGAYQCYGDPFFILPKMERSARSRSNDPETDDSESDDTKSAKASRPIPKFNYLIAQEAEIDLNNLLNRVDVKGISIYYIRERLDYISGAVDAAGIRNAAITEKEAVIYAECNEYEKAIDKFESLMTMEQAGFTVKALEKYCNIRAKLCVKNWQTGIKKKMQSAMLDKVITDLKQLLNMSFTAERLSLLGSAYKRRAMISANITNKIKSLILSAGYYKRAYEMPKNSNKTYSLTNWMEIEKILQFVKNRPGIKNIIKQYKFASVVKTKADIANTIKKISNTDGDMDFWNEIGIANAFLCLWLLEGGNTVTVTDLRVVDAYKKVWNIAGSQNKKIAEIEHFDFLIDAYSLFGKSKIVRTIKKIRQELETAIK